MSRSRTSPSPAPRTASGVPSRAPPSESTTTEVSPGKYSARPACTASTTCLIVRALL
jgi:hypothetical protein